MTRDDPRVKVTILIYEIDKQINTDTNLDHYFFTIQFASVSVTDDLIRYPFFVMFEPQGKGPTKSQAFFQGGGWE